jgi:hypothetical protein
MWKYRTEFLRPVSSADALALLAMLIETTMSLASPWPLKIVLDSVFDARPLLTFPPAAGPFSESVIDPQRHRRRNRGHRAPPGRQRVFQRLLHRQHRPAHRPRPSPERLRPPPASLDVLPRPSADRALDQHHHRRHQRRPGLRVEFDSRPPDRQPRHRRDNRCHVLAELDVYARCAPHHAAAGALRLSPPIRHQNGHSRRSPPSERTRYHRAGRPRSQSASSKPSPRANSSATGSAPRAPKVSRPPSIPSGAIAARTRRHRPDRRAVSSSEARTTNSSRSMAFTPACTIRKDRSRHERLSEPKLMQTNVGRCAADRHSRTDSVEYRAERDVLQFRRGCREFAPLMMKIEPYAMP